MKKKMKVYTLDEVLDRHIGKRGTPAREKFEYELRMDIISDLIKDLRKKQKLTQGQLGKKVGVQKAQISKLESGSGNVTLGTVVRVFSALGNQMEFSLKPFRKKRPGKPLDPILCKTRSY